MIIDQLISGFDRKKVFDTKSVTVLILDLQIARGQKVEKKWP